MKSQHLWLQNCNTSSGNYTVYPQHVLHAATRVSRRSAFCFQRFYLASSFPTHFENNITSEGRHALILDMWLSRWNVEYIQGVDILKSRTFQTLYIHSLAMWKTSTGNYLNISIMQKNWQTDSGVRRCWSYALYRMKPTGITVIVS